MHEQETIAAAKMFGMTTPMTAQWKAYIEEYKGKVSLVYEQLTEADGKSILTQEEVYADQQISELYAEEMVKITELLPLNIQVTCPGPISFSSQGSPASPDSPATPLFKRITLQEFAESTPATACTTPRTTPPASSGTTATGAISRRR